jgi:hypothetical protein
VYTVKEYKETLLVSGKYFGLEVNADKTRYTVISGNGDSGRRHNKSIKNFERMEENKYWGTTRTNQSYIQEEIKSRLKSGNVCYHSVHNFCHSKISSYDVRYYNSAC